MPKTPEKQVKDRLDKAQEISQENEIPCFFIMKFNGDYHVCYNFCDDFSADEFTQRISEFIKRLTNNQFKVTIVKADGLSLNNHN